MSSEATVNKTPEIGDHVIFIDAEREQRHALVTHVWPDFCGNAPGVNAVVVHKDPSRDDTYGRQIDRNPTSVVHRSLQPAGGNCWCWPDEL